MNDAMAQFKDTYITECLELLGTMEENLIGLDASASNDTLNAIFRCAHSIKGGAGAFGFTSIAQFTHILEALLDKLREGKLSVTRELTDLLLRARDVVLEMVMAARDGKTLPAAFSADIERELKAAEGGKSVDVSAVSASPVVLQTAASERRVEILFTPHPSLLSNGNEPLLLLRELKTLGVADIRCNVDKLPVLREMAYDNCYLSWTITLTTEEEDAAIREVFEFVDTECDLSMRELDAPKLEAVVEHHDEVVTDGAPHPMRRASDVSGAPPSSIRVDIEKVDRLINMVGEVVIIQAMLTMQSRRLTDAQAADLVRGINEMMQHTRELQEAVMAMRMQPVKSIFSRMPRIVRDLSAQLGKDIYLKTIGENTEVDKTIIEQLSDPLTHMIRNSVDHGVELPDVRVASGKPAQGTILLSAEHRGGKIVITISDDGAGINRERVLKKAREKNVISVDAVLADEAIDALIFAPGFSTAEVVTNVSGRGVGMDVVKRNIEGLGGTVSVNNNPGRGSQFVIALPLTLAILDGMVVRVGAEQYIVPIANIIETLRPKSEEVRHVADGNVVINVRGEFVPVLYLHQLFAVKNGEADASKALVVLVENNNTTLGLVVDELVGQQQVVIKSLEENADPVDGVSGATILGDGKVSLILDIAGLCRMQQSGLRQHSHHQSQAA